MKLSTSTPTADPKYTHLRDVFSGVVIVCGGCPLGRIDRGHWTEQGCRCGTAEQGRLGL